MWRKAMHNHWAFSRWGAIALISIGIAALPARAPTRAPAGDTTAWLESQALTQLRQRLSSPEPSGYGFSCSPALPGELGMTCMGKLPLRGNPYPQPVSLLVASQFSLEPGATAHYLVHLLGYSGLKPWDGTLAGNLSYFNFLSPLSQSGAGDEILVIPGTLSRCSTYENYFGAVSGSSGEGKSGAFDDWMSELVKVTQIDVREITLSSHSGAFRAMQAIVDQASPSNYAGKISGLGLFDTTYWPSSPSLEHWARAPGHRLWDAYRPDTAPLSRALELALGGATHEAKFISEPASQDHWDLVRDHYGDALSFLTH